MSFRRVISGIAVLFSAAIVVSSGWGQSRPSRKDLGYVDTRGSRTPGPAGYTDYGSYDYSTPYYDTSAYNEAVKKSVESLKTPAERLAIQQINADLEEKSDDDILFLKFVPELCQNMACLGVSPDTVRPFVAAQTEKRATKFAQGTALRSAAAAERSAAAAESSKQIAEAALGFSFLSVLISFLTFWRAVRSAKSTVAA